MENEIKDRLNLSMNGLSQDKSINFFNFIKGIQIGFILATSILFIYWLIGPTGYNPHNVSCSIYPSRCFMYGMINKFVYLSYVLFPVSFLYQIIFSFSRKSWRLFSASFFIFVIQFILIYLYAFSMSRYGIDIGGSNVSIPAMPI